MAASVLASSFQWHRRFCELRLLLKMTGLVAVWSTIPRLIEHLRAALPNVFFMDVTPFPNPLFFKNATIETSGPVITALSQVEILVADPHLLLPHVEKLHNVKWVQATWAGLENLLTAIKDKDIDIPFIITRFSGHSFGYAISEYVVSQIVNFERDQRQQYNNQKNRTWNEEGKISNHRRLCDLTIGIFGLGEIGSFIAKVLKTFGAKVWGMTRTIPAEKCAYVDMHVATKDLSKLLRNCDYVINALPETEITKGMLNGTVLKHCATKGSVFINIGRGSIVKESYLINALEKKWISGAILDVFEREPLCTNSKLWKYPQVTISPHVSGISKPGDIAKVFAENYAKYQIGQPVKYLIDVNRGY